MAKGTTDRSLAASCAEYDSEEGEINDTRRQANITVKRSGGFDKDKMATEAAQQPDLQSDSGYSSRTQATAASADSEQSLKMASKAATSEVTVSSAASSSRKSTASGGKTKTKCKDPNCTKTHHKKSSSKTSSTTSAPKTIPRPPRAPSPQQTRNVRVEERQQPPRQPPPPQRRPSMHAGQRPSSYHQGMPYPLYAHPGMQQVPYPPRYPGAGQGQMVVNRAVRPPLTHLTTDIPSARAPNPRSAYTPTVLHQQQAKSRTVHSARQPPKNSGFKDPFEDEDEETSEGETESEEDDQPTAEMMHAAKLQKLQMDRLRAQQILVMEQRKKEQERAELQRVEQQRAAYIAAHKAKAEAERMSMPPPPRPASAVNGAYGSMRRPKEPPVVTYNNSADIAAGLRPSLLTDAYKNPSYPQAAAGARTSAILDQALHHLRRSSVYGTDQAELERERTLRGLRAEADARAQLQRRESQRGTTGLDPDQYRRQLRRLQFARDEDEDDEDEDKFEEYDHHPRESPRRVEAKQLSDAQGYIDRQRRNTNDSKVTSSILRKPAQQSRETASIRSKQSSRDGSSTGSRRRPPSVVNAVGATADDDGFKMRIDTEKDYDIEIGDKRLLILPNDSGTHDLIIAGKRETQYHSSKASTSVASKVSRRTTRRTRYEDKDNEDDDDDEDRRTLRSERRSVRSTAPRDGARRRAETYSYEGEGRPRRAAPVRAPSPDGRSAFHGEQARRPETPEEERYEPPRYGTAAGYTPQYGQYQPPSPPLGYGLGGNHQSYPGF